MTAGIHLYPPGETAPHIAPGDFILVRGRSVASTAVRMAQRLKGRARRGSAARIWSHAALVVGHAGRLAEVVAAGVVITDLEKYRPFEYHLVRLDLSLDERRRVVHQALGALGRPYGRWGPLLYGLALLSGGRVRGDWPRQNCAALIAHALGGVDPPLPVCYDLTPADLAVHFGVVPSREGPAPGQ